MRDKPRFNKPGQVRRAAPGSQSGTEVIYGRNAVMETLHKSTRTIHEILVLPQHKDELLEASGGIPVRVLPRPDLDRITSTSHHQGMAARVTPYAYAELKDLYAKRCVLLLDSVEDPQNLGAIIRSAYALADAGVIIPEHRSAPVTPSVVKASSGATEHMKIARVKNLRAAAQELKKNGFWLVGLEADACQDIRTTPRFDKLGLVLGGEDSGIRPVMSSELDLAVNIPMKAAFNSLNVSQAATIALYELVARGR